MDKYKEFENISLSELRYFFHPLRIKVLNKIGVNNLSDFFQLSDNKLIDIFKDPYVAYRMLSAKKLLKCKYLDEDPLIDMNSDNRKIYEMLGMGDFHGEFCDYLEKENLNIFEFVRKCSNDSLYCATALKDLRIHSFRIYESLYPRAMIVIDYYDKHKDDSKIEVNEGNEKEILESLYAELKRLKEENARIDNQISVILQKIEEMGLSESKGGIKK